MKIHKCKAHDYGHNYTVCPDCHAEYCDRIWPECPRVAWHWTHGKTHAERALRMQASAAVLTHAGNRAAAARRAHTAPAEVRAMTEDQIIDTIGAVALREYADPARHAIHVDTGKDLSGDYQSRAICACGWRSIPVPWESQARQESCPVLAALRERADRMRS